MTFAAGERALLELASVLDRPFRSDARYPYVALGLSHRARSLFRAVSYLAAGPVPVVMPVMIRPLTEVYFTLRFLALDPPLHTDLWIAEETRWKVSFIEAVRDRKELERWRSGIDMSLIQPRRAELKAIRTRALRAGVPGVQKTGALFPTVRAQVEAINDVEAWQTYYFVYGHFGADVHAGLLSFEHVRHEEVREGFTVHRDEPAPGDLDAERALSITIFAAILTRVSAALDLDIGDAADAIRLRFIQRGELGSQSGGEAS